jgi:hypothetical protein
MVAFLGSICFALAVIHTFFVKRFQHHALRYRSGSLGNNFFHFLGEIEVVFGVWAGIYLLGIALGSGPASSLKYLNSRSFVEPAFVFVVMVISATRPIVAVMERGIHLISSRLPLPRGVAFYMTLLIVGPILGSIITEPAAMTMIALVLWKKMSAKSMSTQLMYATLGLLFVNVSIGGTLTPFAAPPVIMVATQWHWDFQFMMSHFGWKAILAIVTSTALVAFKFRKELSGLPVTSVQNSVP